MIKRTDISKLSNPKVMKNKNSYSNKGSVSYAKKQTFSSDTTPKPGMGKGKSRGVGIAESGTKFSGVY
jgi:hypothetical protein|tara:strand:+ start:117 stop:320 length:204 start_codon:yes stop_codon:yes gene_type:complete